MATENALKQVSVNSQELKVFLKYIVDNNHYLQKNGKNPTAIEIEGDTGLGKTSSVIQLSQELGVNFVKVNLAQIEELGDLVGFPVRQFQLYKKEDGVAAPAAVQTAQIPKKVKKPVEKIVEEVKTVPKQVPGPDGKLITKNVQVKVKVKRTVMEEVEEEVENFVCSTATPKGAKIWVDEQAVQEYLKQGYAFTGKKQMSYCPPEWIADKDNGGFLVLDDYNRADVRFLQATMELVDRQEYISWKLPKGWTILLTANPDNGDYLVQAMDDAQKTRFIRTQLKFDIDCWAEWAEKDGIDGRCINFLLMHPEMVTQKVNPRSITTFFNAISSIKDFGKELPLVQMIGEGCVGPEFSTSFNMFINNKLDKLVSPKDMLLNENDGQIMTELRSCIGTGEEYRADIASVLTTRLINWTLHYAEKNPITQENIDRLIALSTNDILTDDLKYILVKKVLNGNKQKFQKLLINQAVQTMAMK